MACCTRLRPHRLCWRDWGSGDFEEFIRKSVKENARTAWNEKTWRQLSSGFRFVGGSFDDEEAFDKLASTVKELDETRGTGGNHAFYLSIPPNAFPTVVSQLARSGLNDDQDNGRFRRIIVEKPFGHDLKSALDLAKTLQEVLLKRTLSESTTTWVRKLFKTFLPCGLQTSCLSRCGTRTT